MAIELTKYAVAVSNPPYEIRDYEPAVVAIVTVDGSRGDAVSAGFRILANYIFGQNQQKSKIAMTAPVTQIPSGAQPVDGKTPISAADLWSVRFMMPAAYSLESLPTPSDRRVHFEKLSARRVAAIHFSGFWSDDNLKSHESQLLQWLQRRHLTPASAPTYAYYDPPWTPWFMRRNEVLVDVAPPRS